LHAHEPRITSVHREGLMTDTDETKRTIYAAYLEDLGRIGGRHETARAFYLSILSAVGGLLALTGTGDETERTIFLTSLALTGMIISLAWFVHMFAFGTLFDSKRKTLIELEENFSIEPFTLEKKNRHWFHFRLTIVDRIVAGAFIALFFCLWLGKFPLP